MTENEAKDILNEIMELDDSMAQYNPAYMEAMKVAINALEEVQQYRAYKEKFKAIYGDCDNALEVILDLILKYEFEQMKGSYIIRLLTDEDAKKWDEYKQIGTPEECLRHKDFLDFLADKMNPNDFETYLLLYNALEEKGCEQ